MHGFINQSIENLINRILVVTFIVYSWNSESSFQYLVYTVRILSYDMLLALSQRYCKISPTLFCPQGRNKKQSYRRYVKLMSEIKQGRPLSNFNIHKVPGFPVVVSNAFFFFFFFLFSFFPFFLSTFHNKLKKRRGSLIEIFSL